MEDMECRMKYFVNRSRWCCICVVTLALLWLFLLVASIVIHIQSRDNCDRDDVFGKFGICILVYLTVRYVIDTVLSATTWYQYRRFLCNRVWERIEDMHKLPDMDDSVGAGILKSHGATRHIREIIHMSADIAEDEYRREMLGRCCRCQDGTPSNVERSLYDIKNIFNRSEPATTERKPTIYATVIFLGMDTVPLLTVVFYIFLGVDDNVPSGANICLVSLVFNWFLVGLIVLHCLFRLLPPLIHWTAAKAEKTE